MTANDRSSQMLTVPVIKLLGIEQRQSWLLTGLTAQDADGYARGFAEGRTEALAETRALADLTRQIVRAEEQTRFSQDVGAELLILQQGTEIAQQAGLQLLSVARLTRVDPMTLSALRTQLAELERQPFQLTAKET